MLKLKMKAEEYKRIIKENNVLDFGTLKVTKEQLDKTGNKRLGSEIERIITDNKIDKPLSHNDQVTQETDFYLVDLDTDDIETIVSMFGDLEVGALGIDYETTRAASFYASILDKWNYLPDYR